jgi:hypothetical protein
MQTSIELRVLQADHGVAAVAATCSLDVVSHTEVSWVTPPKPTSQTVRGKRTTPIQSWARASERGRRSELCGRLWGESARKGTAEIDHIRHLRASDMQHQNVVEITPGAERVLTVDLKLRCSAL